jgi:O-antigen ligase
MSVVEPAVRPARFAVAQRGLAGLLGTVAALLLGLALAGALYLYPPPAGIVVAGGVGLLGVLSLALARFEAAVALGFLLLPVARFQVDPADAVFVVVVATALVTGRADLRRVPALVIGLLGTLVFLNLLSTVEIVDLGRAIAFLPITLFLVVFAIWLAGYASSTFRVRSLIRAYVAAAVISAALGSLALFVAMPGSEVLTFQGERARAFFSDPNVFGPFLVPAALILLEETLSPRLLRTKRPPKLVLFSVVSLGVVFSYSRAAWLSYAVGIAVMLVVFALRRGGSRKALPLLAVLFAAAAFVSAAVELTGSRAFLEQRAQFQSYDVERFGAQRSGLEFAQAYPLGIGPGQFEVASPVAAHSTYIRVLAEEGVLGLVVVLALLLVTLLMASSNAIVGRDTYGLGSAALLGAWCGILAVSAFVDTLHFRMLWVVAALIWAGWARGRRDAWTVRRA